MLLYKEAKLKIRDAEIIDWKGGGNGWGKLCISDKIWFVAEICGIGRDTIELSTKSLVFIYGTVLPILCFEVVCGFFLQQFLNPLPPNAVPGGGGTVYAYSCPVCNFFLHCHWHIKIWHIDSLSWDNVSSSFMILVWPTFLPQSQIYIFLTLIHVQNHYIFCLLWHFQIIFGKYVYRIVTMCRVHSRYQYDIDLWPRGQIYRVFDTHSCSSHNFSFLYTVMLSSSHYFVTTGQYVVHIFMIYVWPWPVASLLKFYFHHQFGYEQARLCSFTYIYQILQTASSPGGKFLCLLTTYIWPWPLTLSLILA